MREMYFRFVDYGTESGADVYLHRFHVVRRTPKGAWITRDGGAFFKEKERFVLNESHKRFAWPSVPEAYESFIARKKRQIRLYNGRIWQAERAMEEAETLLSTIQPDPSPPTVKP